MFLLIFSFFSFKQIAEDMRPHPMVISVLTKLCNFIPTWRIVPTQDVVDLAFRDPQVRKEVTTLFSY